MKSLLQTDGLVESAWFVSLRELYLHGNGSDQQNFDMLDGKRMHIVYTQSSAVAVNSTCC
jgi:hypothetical protein